MVPHKCPLHLANIWQHGVSSSKSTWIKGLWIYLNCPEDPDRHCQTSQPAVVPPLTAPTRPGHLPGWCSSNCTGDLTRIMFIGHVHVSCRVYTTTYKQACCTGCRRGPFPPPIGKIYPFTKTAVTFEPMIQFWCPLRFRKFFMTMI
jgi:hypothetical protein